MWEKYKKIFLRILKKFRNFKTQTFFGVKNFKSLLISIPKCKQLNSELILVLGFGSGPHPGPRINIWCAFFSIRPFFGFVWVKMALRIYNKIK
jgi:hypothetical protein